MDLLALHVRKTRNIGDKVCSPLGYFEFFPELCEQIVLSDFRNTSMPSRTDVVIWGGGALGTMPEFFQQRYPEALFVGWGVGCTNRLMEPVTRKMHLRASQGFHLWGGRDYGGADDYVPCVSCMSPLFDLQYTSKHEVVCYGHSGARPLDTEADALGIPYLDNTTPKSLEEAVSFLASGECIVTSSFHGVYWASLLGKKVAMIPFGRKFLNLKFRPPIVDNVKDGIKEARYVGDSLADARRLNLDFALRVKDLLKSRSN